MKKKNKTLIILLAVLAVICVAAIVVVKVGDQQEKIKNTDEVVVSFETEDATKLSWTYKSTTTSFTKTDGVWYLDSDDTYPVDQDVIEDQLELINSYQASFVIDEPQSLGTYSIGSSSVTVNVTAGDAEYEIQFGGYSSMDSERYFSVGDGKVYLASEDVMDSFGSSAPSYIKCDEMPTSGDLDSLTVSGANNFSVQFTSEPDFCYTDLYNYYCEENGTKVPADTDLVTDLFNTVTGLDTSDYETYNASTADLSKYGLDDPAMNIAIVYVNEDEEAVDLNISLGNADKKYYFRIADSEFVCAMDEDDYNTFLELTYDDVKPTDIANVDWDDVSSVKAVISGTTYSLVKSDDTFKYGDKEIETSTIETKLAAVTVSEFTDETNNKSQELQLTFAFEGQSTTSYRVQFFTYDADSCLVYINGSPYALTSRTNVTNLREAILAQVL